MDEVEFSFIDVLVLSVDPHDDFGATGLDAVMLCVSATDSVMPQTVEHLNILNLLGIEAGLIAITMCDLADEEDMNSSLKRLKKRLSEHLENAP